MSKLVSGVSYSGFPLFCFAMILGMPATVSGVDWPPANAQALTWDDDIASRMVAGCDRFLLKQVEAANNNRERHWKRDFTSPAAYSRSIASNRERLRYLLGMADARHEEIALELIAPLFESTVVARGEGYELLRVRWRAFGNVFGEGLLAQPSEAPKANVVAIPDADTPPEALFGLIDGVPRESQYARVLAEQGCRVLVPTLIDRTLEPRNGRANMTHREFLYRPSFVLGRHLIGYELHKILAGVDWFEQQADREPSVPTGVIGWGEGGMLALYAGAIDTRIDATCASGFFDRRDRIWEEPLSRNVYARLVQFGDAELAAMVHPRSLVVEACHGPELTLPAGQGGAPAVLGTPDLASVRSEWSRFETLVKPLPTAGAQELVVSGDDGNGAFGSRETIVQFLIGLNVKYHEGRTSKGLALDNDAPREPAAWKRYLADRMRRQVTQIVDHNRQVLHGSAAERGRFMSRLDTSSAEAFERTQRDYREHFAEETIGTFDLKRLPPHPRIRKAYDHEKWIGYEVVLDVYPDVFAYGILCVPKGIGPNEKRPVVVCQHGLEGTPQMVVEGDHAAYHDFAAKLAERGFVTFSPQNIYKFGDRFRTLQRKAYPLKKTLFSIMVPQHRQITDWLAELPFVDSERIAFYGLSYGGKSAMRIPPLVDRYCLSICSADFNEWVWKNASTDARQSYVWTGEYEIFEFNLGGTFNYAEMAALIAPRPFMVERGHFDGVAPDETVAYEFAKVRSLYAAKLGIADRCEIEWFVGPHTINGKGTFEFLHRHLDWPATNGEAMIAP